MKRLYLSIVVTVSSEEGQKRIDKALEKNNIDFIEGVYVDEYGRSREKYGDLGINPPEGFTEAEKAFRKSFLTSEINENGEISDVCVGTNEMHGAEAYLQRERRTGDFHGQAPVLWCANALIQ